jgi:hypothetical protein
MDSMRDINWLTTILGCLVWMPIAVWVISLIHWMIMGELEIPIGIVGVVLGFGLGYTALKPPENMQFLSPLAVFLVVGTVVLYPFLRNTFERHQLRGLDCDSVEKAYLAIGQQPTSPFAKFKLAEGIYRLGMIGHAVAIADSVMAYIPERAATDEFRTLRRWKQAGVPPETNRPIPCVECHTPCQPGWTHCKTCGAPFLLDRVKGRILPKGHARLLIAIWAAIVAPLIGIPAATALKPVLAVPAIVLIIGLSVGFIVIAVRSAGDRAE